MGCSSSREKNESIEEVLISRCEESLGYSNLTCHEIDCYYHKFTQNLKLTENQFIAATEELKLDMRNYFITECKLHKFYESFRMKDGLFSVRMLSALGVLIGKGSTKEKAEILFTNYDVEITDTLDSMEMQMLITDVVKIAIVILPMYAKETAESNQDKKILEEYTIKLQQIKAAVHEHYKSLLITGESMNITNIQFVSMFTNSEICSIVCSRNIRELALKKISEDEKMTREFN